MYGQYYYADLTREDTTAKKDDYLKNIEFWFNDVLNIGNIKYNELNNKLNNKIDEGKNKQLNDEWSVDQFIFAESKNFLINNLSDVFKSILKKISVIFWYPYKDSQWNEIDAKKLRFSNIPNKLIFITSIIVL
jgi:phage-related protein